ncbi:hypothetical protein [Alteromonas mediterranea]|uniref:hypothetical protein n=1 Tax=Alteromonas mediterranea TaxID=314275 RepID=UPI001E4A203E|nr:hypothetical protein [Alteromonas mediterranea]
MNFLFSTNKRSYPSMTNEELREAFLTEPLFTPGKLSLTYTDVDRAVIGGAMPTDSPIELPTHKELAADYFCERRELGIINIGGKGAVKVDGKDYTMAQKDSLYVSRGSKEVTLFSDDPNEPAKFYMVSYPSELRSETY